MCFPQSNQHEVNYISTKKIILTDGRPGLLKPSEIALFFENLYVDLEKPCELKLIDTTQDIVRY